MPTVGQFGDVAVLVELAVAAERHGWDGVHLWDHVLYHHPGWPVASPVVVAAAIAARTSRIRIILTLALPRRQVQDAAQDTAAIAALSGGRLTVLATIGSMDREYAEFGLDPDLRARGRALDDRLVRLRELWARWGAPEIPIWCGGRWPNTAGLRRAARFDGAMPTFDDQRVHNVPPLDFEAAATFLRRQVSATGRADDADLAGAANPHAARAVGVSGAAGTATAAGRVGAAGRPMGATAETDEPAGDSHAGAASDVADRAGGSGGVAGEPGSGAADGGEAARISGMNAALGRRRGGGTEFDIAIEGMTDGPRDLALIAPYAAAGATWWVEALGWWRGDLDAARARIESGPARAG